jgi:integrase
LYLAALAATHKPGSLRRRLTAIGKAHEAAGYESPASTRHLVVGETLKGIRRTLGTAQVGKRPLLTKEIRTMVEALPENLQGARDRALLLMGFAGGFRRSELAALGVEDVTLCEEGLIVRLRRSKTDQEGAGRLVALPYGSNPSTCPVRACRKWRDESGIQEGALFRGIDRHGALAPAPLHKDSIGLIVKRAVQRIGLAPADYAGHSLRAGLATEAYRNGATEFAIMQQTGHRSVATLGRYIREGSLFRDNAAAKLGL